MVGRLIDNLRYHDRIVGGINEWSTYKAKQLYTPILVGGRVIEMTATAAEVTKTAENTFRDLQIAAANQLALYCETMGVNFYDVKGGVDSLKGEGITRAMLNPGAGVGGHCLTKDAYHLERGVRMMGNVDFPDGVNSLYTTARDINDFMPTHMYNLMLDAMSKAEYDTSLPKIVILGKSFISDSGDIRDSPSDKFEKIVKETGFTYEIHDPYVDGIDGDFNDAIYDSDILVIFTGHTQYKKLLKNPYEIKKTMGCKNPIIVDGRNIIDADDYINHGFIYRGIGRGDKNNQPIDLL
jgi:UDP-N-acetyl-D-mannosaminuronic acid dehydrogenase